MFYVSPEGGRYYLGRAFDYNELQYTKAGATDATFTELGFTKVTPAETLEVSPRDLAKTQLSFVQQQLEQAQRLLTASDWLYIRAGEANAAAVPPSVQTERDAVRSVMDTNCDLICGTSSIPELEALIKAPAEIAEDESAED